MPTPATPTLSLCDKLVEVIREDWDPSGDDVVERTYEAPHKIEALSGRKVYVFPASYDSTPADRGSDQYAHRIVVLTIERYVDQGRPPTAWMDERADFVFERIYSGLDFSHDGPLVWEGREVVTTGAGPVDVYDPDVLVRDKAFWSECEFEFLEIL